MWGPSMPTRFQEIPRGPSVGSLFLTITNLESTNHQKESHCKSNLPSPTADLPLRLRDLPGPQVLPPRLASHPDQRSSHPTDDQGTRLLRASQRSCPYPHRVCYSSFQLFHLQAIPPLSALSHCGRRHLKPSDNQLLPLPTRQRRHWDS